MMDKEIIGQIIGIIAATLAVISFQQKTHKYIVAFQLAANVAFILNFGLIGNTAGAILNGVALIRALVFVNKGRKWADNPLWLWFFCGLCIAAGWYTWTDWRTILPTLGMICTTVAFWIKTPMYVRMMAFTSSPLWLVYNSISTPPAIGGIVTEVVNMISIIIAIMRLDLKKNKVNNIQK